MTSIIRIMICVKLVLNSKPRTLFTTTQGQIRSSPVKGRSFSFSWPLSPDIDDRHSSYKSKAHCISYLLTSNASPHERSMSFCGLDKHGKSQYSSSVLQPYTSVSQYSAAVSVSVSCRIQGSSITIEYIKEMRKSFPVNLFAKNTLLSCVHDCSKFGRVFPRLADWHRYHFYRPTLK